MAPTKGLFVLLPVVWAQQTNLCYRVNYGYRESNDTYANQALVYPVKAFPKNHAVVTQGYCGGANAGDPIPTQGIFGDKDTDEAACQDAVGDQTNCITPPYTECEGVGQINGGGLFYAYDMPNSDSSNTGYQKAEVSDIYYVQDDSNNVFLVLNHDKPDTGTGGQIRLNIESAGLNGMTYVAQKDDTVGDEHFGVGQKDGCIGHDLSNRNDCFAWDESEGKGSFAWWWSACCTDGLVLGPLPAADFQITLDYIEVEDINSFRFGSYNETSNDLDFEWINRTTESGGQWATPSTKFMVEGYTCSQYCALLVSEIMVFEPDMSELDQCYECDGNEACAWCPEQSNCVGHGECDNPTNDCDSLGLSREPTPPTPQAPTKYPTPPPQTLPPFPSPAGSTPTTGQPTTPIVTPTTGQPTPAGATPTTGQPTPAGATPTTAIPSAVVTPVPTVAISPQPTTAAVDDSATETTVVDGATTTTTTTTTEGTSTAVTTVNTDGTTTTTTTAVDGSTSTAVTTTNADGSSSTTTTAADGTESTAVTTVSTDGTTTTTTTAADGSTSTAVTTRDPADQTTTTTVTTNEDGSTSTSTVTRTTNSNGSVSVTTSTTTTAATADPTPAPEDKDKADVSGVSSAYSSIVIVAGVATLAMAL